MDQSPTDSYADSGLWNREQKPSFREGSTTATTGKSKGGASVGGGRQITRNRASYSCHSCRRRKVKCDKVRDGFVWVGLCRILTGSGPSSMRELREERKRMCIRCRAPERDWIARGTSKGWWTWSQTEKGDIAAI